MIRPNLLLAVGLIGLSGFGLYSATTSIARSNLDAEGASAVDATVTATVDTPLVLPSIGALGTVEPAGGKIEISPPISGIVSTVYVTPGQRVAAGQALFQLDDRIAQKKLYQAEQSVASAEASLMELDGTLPSLESAVAAANASLAAIQALRDEAAADLEIAQLQRVNVTISRREVESRVIAMSAAEAQLDEAQARLDLANADLDRADALRDGSRRLPLLARIAEAQAALETARTELEILTVRSPINGVVLAVGLRPGEFTGTGANTSGLTLGADGPLQVRVEVEEADVPRLAEIPSARAAIRGEAQWTDLNYVRREPLVSPKRVLSGENAERIDTRVLEVLFEIEGEATAFLPGQLLDVLIEPQPLALNESAAETAIPGR